MLLEQWPLIEQDLSDAGIDVGDDVLMESRSWRWFEVKVAGLLNRPRTLDLAGNASGTRLQRHFLPIERPAQQAK